MCVCACVRVYIIYLYMPYDIPHTLFQSAQCTSEWDEITCLDKIIVLLPWARAPCGYPC